MPINIQHDSASALKVGHESVSASYIGHEQVYPNTVEITNLRFPTTDAGVLIGTNTVPVGGATLSDQYNVEITGALGSTFTLYGGGGVNSSQFNNPYTLTTSPYRFRVAIDSNNSCDAGARTPVVGLTPTGSTVVAGGVANPTGSAGQAAGPTYQSFSTSASFSVTENSRVLTYIGGTPFFTTGSSWTVTVTVPVNTTQVSQYGLSWYRGNASVNTTGTTFANNAGSATHTFNITGGTAGYVRFNLTTYANGGPPNCWEANPLRHTTSNYYP